MKKKIVTVLGSICLVLVLAVLPFVTACAAPPPVPQTIKIGAVLPLTGMLAFGGNMCKAGYEIGLEHINQAGGVFVKEYNKKIPLELIMLDNESDPVKEVSRLETLYERDKVTVYLSGAGSHFLAAGAAIAEKNKVPLVGVAFTLWDVHQKGFGYLFSPSTKSPDLAVGMFDLLDSLPPAKKATKVALLRLKTDWGIEIAGMWQDEAVKRGYEVVTIEEYTMQFKDFTPLILAAKSAGAEVVLSNPVMPDGLALMKQMKELDYNPTFVGFVRAASAATWGEALGKDGDYVINFENWHYAVTFPGNDKLNESYMEKHGEVPDVIVGSAYASIQILADAIERAGTLDSTKIRDAIAATDMMTVLGPITFRADGTAVVTAIGIQWQAGEQELIWPEKFATVPFAYPMPKWTER